MQSRYDITLRLCISAQDSEHDKHPNSQLQSKSTARIGIKHTHRRCSFTACTALSKLPSLAPESRHGRQRPGSHEAQKCKTPSPRAATRPPSPKRFVQPLANSHASSHANGSLIKPLPSRSNLVKQQRQETHSSASLSRAPLQDSPRCSLRVVARLPARGWRIHSCGARCHLACAPCGCDPAARKKILPLKTFRR